MPPGSLGVGRYISERTQRRVVGCKAIWWWNDVRARVMRVGSDVNWRLLLLLDRKSMWTKTALSLSRSWASGARGRNVSSNRWACSIRSCNFKKKKIFLFLFFKIRHVVIITAYLKMEIATISHIFLPFSPLSKCLKTLTLFFYITLLSSLCITIWFDRAIITKKKEEE